MRLAAIGCAAVVLCGLSLPWRHKRPAPEPSRFVIGTDSFWDVGPPFSFYSVYVVRGAGEGSSVKRYALTPPGQKCVQPAKLDFASATLKESVPELLGPGNPCAIPEKELRRKPKRCKKCLVFSGAIVVMQVQCGAETRTIRSDILDRDMFGPAANVPRSVSWTMRLLAKLDDALGPGPEKTQRIFPIPGKTQPPTKPPDSPELQRLAAGGYDGLFSGGSFRLSKLYAETQLPPPPPPTARLVSSTPIAPVAPAMPGYPPIAVLAHVEGSISFDVKIGPDGRVKGVAFVSGAPLLREVVKDAVEKWNFPKGPPERRTRVTLSFVLNCLHQQK